MIKNTFSKTILLLSIILIFGIVGTVAAQALVTVKVQSVYNETIGNYSAEIQTPQISGMTDTAMQDSLNREFSEYATELAKDFTAEALEIQKEYPVDGPHKWVEYKLETVYNNSSYLVFYVYEFSAVGSSNYVAQYFTIDKNTGKLVSLEEMTGNSKNYMEQIENYIYKQMRDANNSGDMKYWIDDDAINQNWGNDMDLVFSKIEDNRQYYLNEAGNLVIAFNKYEVGPGAIGSPQFEVPMDVFRDN
ncbi:MAG: DUF3298 and DUF4163 domain-containing protein [Chloroflexi bacterium]|nr:DUF3298 and DUF4163 domain-containing protein [Chloroflexota bacterium]